MMLYRIKSRKTLSEVARDLEAAVQRHKFGVMAAHDLKAKLNEKGVEFGRECLVYEICNPLQAKKVLEADLEISTALPCRISIYSEGSGVTLATLRPTALVELFHSPQLKAVAEEVETIMLKIMGEVAK